MMYHVYLLYSVDGIWRFYHFSAWYFSVSIYVFFYSSADDLDKKLLSAAEEGILKACGSIVSDTICNTHLNCFIPFDISMFLILKQTWGNHPFPNPKRVKNRSFYTILLYINYTMEWRKNGYFVPIFLSAFSCCTQVHSTPSFNTTYK